MFMLDNEIMELLYRIDDGYVPTKVELRRLRGVTKVFLTNVEYLREELPASMYLLANLREFSVFRRTSISSLEPLSKIKSLRIIRLWEGTSLSDLSPLVNNIDLQELIINYSPISDISVLGRLKKLRYLSLRDTEIEDISPLVHLTNLESLNIINVRVTNITPISKLPKLQDLRLYGVPIADISCLSALPNLSILGFNGSQTTSPEFGEWFPNITELNLAGSPISDLSSLYPCTKLERLSIPYTGIHILPTWLGERMSLKNLDLSGLNLHDLPASLLELDLPFKTKYDFDSPDGIHIGGTTLAVQPISLFEQDRAFIQAYYDAEKVPINESKVIFLGDGGVGKTHTIKRILNDGKKDQYKTETTPGIDITRYPAEYAGRSFNIHFWDFGGQEIMHAMHRCFLTERTCYVVVLSNRADSDLTARARYWLRNIQSFAPKAKVLLALNRWDNIAAGGIDMSRLLEEYPNLCPEPIHFSATKSSEEDFNLLTRAIIREAAAMDSSSMEFPLQWANIRQKLLDSAQIKHYIDKDDYHHFCTKEGLEDPNIRTWLLEWFNDLGVCFSYHQEKDGNNQPTELESYKVLNPKWLTNAIYIIINHGRDYAESGKLHRNNIRDLLKNPNLGVLKGVVYEQHEQEYVLEVMRKFRLSYRVSDTHEFIPALCDANTPKNLHPTDYPQHVAYQLKYTFLPDSVIHQLMIRCYDNLNFTMLWCKGMRLDINFLGLSAVVDMANDDATLRMDVYGRGDAQSWMLLQNLRTHLSEINQSLGLNAEESVIVCDDDGFEDAISIEQLLCAKEEQESEIKIFNKVKKRNFRCNVNELLRFTFGEDAMMAAQEMAIEKQVPVSNVFIGCTFGAVDFNQQTFQPEYMKLIAYLIERQAKLDDKVITALTDALKNSDNQDVQRLAAAAEKDPKKNIFIRMKELVETTGSFAEHSENTYKAGRAIVNAIKPLVPLLATKIPDIIEFFSQLQIGG